MKFAASRVMLALDMWCDVNVHSRFCHVVKERGIEMGRKREGEKTWSLARYPIVSFYCFRHFVFRALCGVVWCGV